MWICTILHTASQMTRLWLERQLERWPLTMKSTLSFASSATLQTLFFRNPLRNERCDALLKCAFRVKNRRSRWLLIHIDLNGEFRMNVIWINDHLNSTLELLIHFNTLQISVGGVLGALVSVEVIEVFVLCCWCNMPAAIFDLACVRTAFWNQ